jgi:hypothetical protein
MSSFNVIRPRDDSAAKESSKWCDDLIAKLKASTAAHTVSSDIDDGSPADQANISAAMSAGVDLICYFGHGNSSAWLTANSPTIDAGTVGAGKGKAVVSIACETGLNLGADAITSGVESWLGFTIKVPVLLLKGGYDPFGEAIVEGLAELGEGKSMQEARDALFAALDQTVDDFDTGFLSTDPSAPLGYYAAMSLRDHVVLHGNGSHVPL